MYEYDEYTRRINHIKRENRDELERDRAVF